MWNRRLACVHPSFLPHLVCTCDRYRLVAVDHDLISFLDTSLHQWPLVLITNPKPAQFMIPSVEPLGRMPLSSHVRWVGPYHQNHGYGPSLSIVCSILVFSPWPVESVLVSLDGSKPAPANCIDGGPLYVLPWQPSRYSHGLHHVSVSVVVGVGARGL